MKKEKLDLLDTMLCCFRKRKAEPKRYKFLNDSSDEDLVRVCEEIVFNTRFIEQIRDWRPGWATVKIPGSIFIIRLEDSLSLRGLLSRLNAATKQEFIMLSGIEFDESKEPEE